MIDERGDLWYYLGKANAVCIPTNGFVKSSGHAVMGKGLAKDVVKLFPGIDFELGMLINKNGNVVQVMHQNKNTSIVAFPVKPQNTICDGFNVVQSVVNKFSVGQRLPGWAAKAELRLIARSCLELVDLANERRWELVCLPQVGAGAGELNWNAVHPILKLSLDDRFKVITFDIPF